MINYIIKKKQINQSEYGVKSKSKGLFRLRKGLLFDEPCKVNVTIIKARKQRSHKYVSYAKNLVVGIILHHSLLKLDHKL